MAQFTINQIKILHTYFILFYLVSIQSRVIWPETFRRVLDHVFREILFALLNYLFTFLLASCFLDLNDELPWYNV